MPDLVGRGSNTESSSDQDALLLKVSWSLFSTHRQTSAGYAFTPTPRAWAATRSGPVVTVHAEPFVLLLSSALQRPGG